MVTIRMDGRHADICFDGTGMNLAMEVGAAISGIYQGLYSQDEEGAEIFKICMQRSMMDESPMWERSHSMTVVTVQK